MIPKVATDVGREEHEVRGLGAQVDHVLRRFAREVRGAQLDGAPPRPLRGRNDNERIGAMSAVWRGRRLTHVAYEWQLAEVFEIGRQVRGARHVQ